MRSLIFLGTILLLYSSGSFLVSKVISTAIEIHCCITALVTNLTLLVIVVAKHIVMPMPKFKKMADHASSRGNRIKLSTL